MSFSGTVDRESHEGGLLVAFEGRAPRLGATLRIIGGKPIGKVNSVIGAIDGAFVHIHPISDEIEYSNTIGSPVEIAPRERRDNRGHGRDRYSKRDGRRDNRSGGKEHKKGGDWNCPKCNNSNFAFRKKCNRCDADRPRDDASKFERKFDRGVNNSKKSGDWTCPKCNNSNFAFRDKCNRCQAHRPSSGGKPQSRGGGNERRGSRPQGAHSGRGRGRSPGSASKPRRSGFRGPGRGGPRGNRPGRSSGRR
ncbi:MAG: zinc finger protein [Euryarchaeota archaeon]